MSQQAADVPAEHGPVHTFDKVQAGENIRLSVALPAHADEYTAGAATVDDYLFVSVVDVERFRAGDIKEMEVEHRERGRLRVRWSGQVMSLPAETAIGRHNGEVLRLDRGTEAV
jgi:NADPH-dependent 2,4-dienoyl-CoA reductase/sulfur reductase-like enzyme